MNSVHGVPDKVYRTRQIALLLSEQDRATALAYAQELEWQTDPAPADRPVDRPADKGAAARRR
jgi:hypothetical protein